MNKDKFSDRISQTTLVVFQLVVEFLTSAEETSC